MKIVQDNKSLKNLCKLLKTQKVIYLDTEFKRDRTYWPKLCTIQFKTQRNVYLVDMLLIEQINMNELKEILIDKKFRKGFTKDLTNVLLSFNEKSKKQKQILELFSAKKFIKSKNENYNQIEKVGRKIGKIK